MTCPTLPVLALRASILSLALAAALPVLASSEGSITETCARPPAGAASAAPADADVKPPLTTIDVVFVTAQFKKPGLAQQEADEEWADWKIDDISRLVTERAPKLLRVNGLEGQVTVLPPVAIGDEPDFSTLDPARPALVFVPAKYSKWSPRFFAKAGALSYVVELKNAGAEAPRMKCRVEVGGGFGFDPIWGIAKTNRVNAEWVDDRITGALTVLARQGVVKLSGEKAVRPAE
ncbi:hypothetical protein [Roseateles chitinivorans]|uniref:hypothetical protein n=1 Tax=Roseateles chitinivorans TaxID=2917965 RepID=UPI003D67D1EC